MSRPLAWENRIPLRAILPTILLMVLGVGAVVAMLLAAAWRQDRIAHEDSIRLLGNVLSREQLALERMTADSAWWPDAYSHLVRVFDPVWADSRLGGPLTRQFGIAGAFVLDPVNRAVFASVDGRPVDGGDAPTSLTGGFSILAERARRQPPPDPGAPTDRMLSPVSSYLRWGDSVVLAAAAQVAAGPEQTDGRVNGTVLVLIRRLGDAELREIGTGFGLADLRLTEQASGSASLPLRGNDGLVLGHLAWTPAQSGRQLIEAVLIPVAAALLAMLGVGLLAVYRTSCSAAALARSSRQLAESEARFRIFAETASDWLWESGPDHVYTFFSGRLGQILGHRPEMVLGGSLLRLVDGDAPGTQAQREAIERRAPFRNIEHTVTLEDGSHRILRISGQPVHDSRGQFQGYRGTGVDITEQVGAARETARIHDLLYDAVESISEGFVLFGADERMVVCNERYRSAYPLLADCLKPGVTFSEVLRVAALRGGFKEAISDLASWVAERLARHMQNHQPTDHRLGDGRWYRISERATRTGGIVKILTDITELKRHEEALARKTALLQGTFDNIMQGICVSDATGRLVDWNANFLKVLDYPSELARIGEPVSVFRDLEARRGTVVSELFTADGDAVHPAARLRVLEMLLPDGRVVEARESPMPDGGMVATYTDITERKRFERVLTELSQIRVKGALFFQALAGSVSRALSVEVAFIAVLDDTGGLATVALAADGRVMRNLAFTLKDLPGGSLPERDIRFCPRNLADTLRPGSPLAAWGAESYLGKTLVDSAHKPIGVIAVLSRNAMERPATARTLLDVFAVRAAAELERLQTETQLQESENRYRQLVERAPYGIVVWDGTEILFTNEAAARIFAAPSAAAMIGSDLARRFGQCDNESFLQRLACPMAGVFEDKPVEVKALTDAGDPLDVEVSIYPFAHQGHAAALVMFNDITHRKRTELALQHAHKMQAVGELAGGIAHEFNNMLTAIGGFAHMARRTPDDPRRIELCLTEIIKASDRASGLTAQLLSFSRRGQTENIRSVPVSRLVDDLEGFLGPVLGEMVKVTYSVRVPDVTITVDPGMMHQAMVNLVLNARDAMPDGGSITVGVDLFRSTPTFREQHPDLRAATYVAITVADTGTGIDKAILDRIFEPFFTTKEQGKGTGLGLPMVYSTVTRVGGTVEVQSDVGVGTTFTLYLPVDAVEAADEAEAGAHAEDLPLNATILLVEDEDQVRNFIRLTLEDHGLRVVSALDGLDALEVFDEHEGAFDLVITDLVMPRAGGVEVARLLEREAPHIPIIFMSGYAPERQAHGLVLVEPGRRAFLSKPIDPSSLIETVRGLLKAPAEPAVLA